jgi:uncharacterized cofD-like protein
MERKEPVIVIIGGGTGSFTLLSSLRMHPMRLVALVSMADSGGSTGVLRDELGILPPGDIRQCLVALSTAPKEMRDLFNFRFPEGTFGGHSFGNLFLSAVAKMTDNFNDAVRMAGEVLRIDGRVLPITLDNCNLVLETDDEKITGEYRIAYSTFSLKNRPKLMLEPKATITEEAKEAILSADLVVIAPGDLYGALVSAMLVNGVGEALKATKAKVAFVCNLVNKPNHTRNFAVHDYADELERFAGGDVLDYVLYNIDQPDRERLEKYALEDEYPVIIDRSKLKNTHYQAIGGEFLSRAEHARSKNDIFITRSLIRHDGHAVAESLLKLI